MSTAKINPHGASFIDGIIEGETVNHGDFQLKSIIKEGTEDHNLIIIECKSVKNIKLWDCDVTISGTSADLDQAFSNTFTFSNYSTSDQIFETPKSLFPYTDCELNFDVVAVRNYDEKMVDFFENRVENITDIKLIVEGQTLYACKKILAQYSSYFYDLFYGDEAGKMLKEYEITDTTCNMFRKFLSMLYHREVTMTMNDFLMLAELSFRFQADHCLEQCEKFLIAQKNIDTTMMMMMGQGFNFRKLYPHIFQEYNNPKQLLALMLSENSENFGEEVKLAMYDRMVELNRSDKYKQILMFDTYKTSIKVIEGIPWKVSFKNERDILTASIQCNWYETVYPWKIDVRLYISGVGDIQNVELSHRKSSYEYCWKIESHSSMPYRLNIWYKNMTGFFKERSTMFSEIRPSVTDIVLSVGDKKYHVSKQILASSSSYFYTMFYSDFAEKNQKEIELKGIDSDEFEEYLQHVYHPNRHITDSNIDGLMNLSRMYDDQRIYSKCKEMAEEADYLRKGTRIKIGEKYDMPELIEATIAQIKTPEDLHNFALEDEFVGVPLDILGRITLKVFSR